MQPRISTGASIEQPRRSIDHWKAFTIRLGSIGEKLHNAQESRLSDTEHEDVNLHLLFSLAAASLALAQLDPDFPDWVPLMNSGSRAGNANPDISYLITCLRGSSNYRLLANPGKSRRTLMSIHDGFLGFSESSSTAATLELEKFLTSSTDEIELFLGPDTPSVTTNWIELNRDAEEVFVLLRVFATDWHAGRDGWFTIQPTDPDRPDLLRPRDLGDRLRRVADYVERFSDEICQIVQDQAVACAQTNEIVDYSAVLAGGPTMRQQVYLGGELSIADEEAFVIETIIPEGCSYWNIQLMDSFYNVLNAIHHPTGLNNLAQRSPDGSTRVIISRLDPGHPNWLAKGDYERVGIRWRLMGCAAPEFRSRIMPLSEAAALADDSDERVTPEERTAELAKRAEGAQRRRRW